MKFGAHAGFIFSDLSTEAGIQVHLPSTPHLSG